MKPLVRGVATANLVLQILIVATGGAVRLTGSGLGCPTWPMCTDESLVSTPEMGIYGVIEFGNRLLSIVVGLVALLLVVLLLRWWRSRRDLLVPALLVLVGTVIQAVVGGISVRVQLDPFVVGSHFLISAVLVALATVVVYRAYQGPPGGEWAGPLWLRTVAYAASAALAVTVAVGVLTTGSGPHAGDSTADRNGLNPEILQHVHSWPAYVTFALTAALIVAVVRTEHPGRRWAWILLGTEVVQIIVGLVQARLGLPPLLVGVHMVLAVVAVSAMAAVMLSLRVPSKAAANIQPEFASI